MPWTCSGASSDQTRDYQPRHTCSPQALCAEQEQDVLRNLVAPYQENSLPSFETERDEFQFHYTASERPHIQNDMITIHHRFATDHLIKLSISHALSQSTKLCVFEERVLEIVASTKDLPEILASTGRQSPDGTAVQALPMRVAPFCLSFSGAS